MIILPGLGVLGIIIALGITLSVTVHPPSGFLLGRRKSAGTRGIWRDAANYTGNRAEAGRGSR